MPQATNTALALQTDESAAERLVHGVLISVMCIATFFILLHFERAFIIGHDEAVYATKASQWLYGFPADQFEIYRPIGMPVMAWLLLHFGSAEGLLRLFGVFFGALLPASVFVLFRQMSNLWVSLAITLVASTSYLFFEQAPRLLDDVPSTTLLLFTMALLYAHFKSGGVTRSIYLAAPLAAGAFYLRYGSVTSLLVIGIFSYLILLPKYLHFERQYFVRIGQSILLCILLVLPHFIYSIYKTKSLFGILQLAGRAAHRVYLGEGLVTYLDLLPKGLGGWILGTSAIIGIFVLIILILSPMREKYLGLTWTGCIGLTSFFITGLLVHAEPRYVFMPIILLAGTGIGGVFYLVGRFARRIAVGLLAGFYVLTAYFGFLHWRELTDFFRREHASIANTDYKLSLLAVRADAAGSPCAIWTALNAPRASWYSKCELFKARDRAAVAQFAQTHPDYALYSVTGTRTDDPQLTPESAERLGLFISELYRINNVPNYGDLVVYRLSKR